MKKRNVIAQDLRTAKYKPRVVKNKKNYSRKEKFGRGKEGTGKESSDILSSSLFCF